MVLTTRQVMAQQKYIYYIKKGISPMTAVAKIIDEFNINLLNYYEQLVKDANTIVGELYE